MTYSIQLNKVSKRFQIKTNHYERLHEGIAKIGNRLLRPLASQKSNLADSNIHTALENISFKVEKGESLGIIGKNGAGKSTLLKLISGVSFPTQGEIKTKGRVSSLLEIGTGFHPELTARENVFLNGILLGMTRPEISKKFDAIISYGGVEKFVDTPVKKFSSGMYIRLAFSVAIQLESDILILDEILAVGDIEFQKRSFDTISEINEKRNKTLLFVSHNMSAVSSVCRKSILLEKGKIIKSGPTKEVIDFYKSNIKKIPSTKFSKKAKSEECSLSAAKIISARGSTLDVLSLGEKASVEIDYFIINNKIPITPFIAIYTFDGVLILVGKASLKTVQQNLVGKNKVRVDIPTDLLNIGEYEIEIGLGIPAPTEFIGLQTLIFERNALSFSISGNTRSQDSVGLESNLGILPNSLIWEKL